MEDNGLSGAPKKSAAWLGVTQAEIKADPKTNDNGDEDDHFTQGLVYAQYSRILSHTLTLDTRLYYNYLDGAYDYALTYYDPTAGNDLVYGFKSHWLGGFANLHYDTDHFEATLGAHAYRYTREHIGHYDDGQLWYDNTGLRHTYSTYARLGYTYGRLHLTADLQYRQTDFQYHGSTHMTPLDWTFFNPKAGITYPLHPNVQLYYSVGKTSREPTRTDLFGGSENLEAGNTPLPIPAESVIDHEAGVVWHTGAAELRANGFYMNFSHEIILRGQFGPNALPLSSSVDKSLRTGAELSATLPLIKDQLTLVQSLTYMHHKIEDQGEIFHYILTPNLLIHQALQYQNGGWQANLSWRYQSSTYINLANTYKLQHYFLLNAQVSYQHKRFTYALYVNNLLSTEYYNYAYQDDPSDAKENLKYFVQAPANGSVQITYAF